MGEGTANSDVDSVVGEDEGSVGGGFLRDRHCSCCLTVRWKCRCVFVGDLGLNRWDARRTIIGSDRPHTMLGSGALA